MVGKALKFSTDLVFIQHDLQFCLLDIAVSKLSDHSMQNKTTTSFPPPALAAIPKPSLTASLSLI